MYPTYNLTNSIIKSGNSSLGGGLYINNPQYMQILNNVFSDNIAINDSILATSGYGGGLYYTCTDLNECNVTVMENNVFNNNYAANSGGAIKWDDLEPVFDSTTSYSSNKAALYANNVGSFAEKLVLLNQTLFEQQEEVVGIK